MVVFKAVMAKSKLISLGFFCNKTVKNSFILNQLFETSDLYIDTSRNTFLVCLHQHLVFLSLFFSLYFSPSHKSL